MKEKNIFHKIEKAFIEYLTVSGFLMVDIGSNGGITCRPGKKLYGCRSVSYMYCDPRDNLKEMDVDIEKTGKDIVINKAVSDIEGYRTFYLTKKGQVSSLQEPNIEEIGKFDDPTRFNVKKKEKIPCTTLDSVIRRYKQEIDYLKIDVQGHESYILESSRKLLRDSSPWIMIEMNNQEYYYGQAKFWELGKKLEDLGYETIDIYPKYNKYGAGKNKEGQCRVFTFADVLWKKKDTPKTSDGLKKEIAKYAAFGKLLSPQCLLLVNQADDQIIKKFVLKLARFYQSGLAEILSEYIV
jgi:FkbM family methyltransferase